MTVCIATFIYYPVPGGIPNYCKHLAENLMATGHRVVILTVDHSGNLADDELVRRENYSQITLNRSYRKYRDHYSRYFRPGGYAAYEWIAAGMAMKDWLVQNHAAFGIDIIETGDYGGLGIFLIDDNLPPLVVIGHSSIGQLIDYNYVPDDDHSRVLQELERLSFLAADGVLVHSPMNLERPPGQRNIVYFSRVPWTWSSFFRPDPPKKNNKNVVIGGLQMTKGAKLMIETAAIQAQKDSAWTVHWTGGDTYTAPGGKKVSEFLADQFPAAWNKNFFWHPGQSHEKAMEEMASADLVFIPSLWDTFNYSALEAVWLEKPIIMTEKTGASYLFVDDPAIRITGVSADAIAASIPADDELEVRTCLMADTKKNLQEYFSPWAIISERMDIYNMLIDYRKTHGSYPSDSLRFLEKYTNPVRKFYYSLRGMAKRLVKPK